MTAKEKAVILHNENCNCAQSVLSAMTEYTGLSTEMSAALGAGFGHGAGCGELCGAIAGAMMVLGAKLGAENRDEVKELGRSLIGSFREEFGAVCCAELKANDIPCDDLIAFAAEKTEELLQ